MAMTVLNNTAAALTIGELNKNISSLGKQLKKVSSGMKLTSAGDSAAEYAISEKMRVRIRALDQNDENTQKGMSLLHVAEGGIQNQIDLLKTVKAKVIDAANDTNTDIDRVTIQKEIKQCYNQIQDLACDTDYNTQRVLLGDDYWKTVHSWIVKEKAEMILDSDSMGVIPDIYPTLDGKTGPFDIFDEYDIVPVDLPAVGVTGTPQRFSGGSDGSPNTINMDLSGYASVADFENVGFSFEGNNYVLTQNPGNNYRDSSNLTVIDISGCSSVDDVAGAIAAQISGATVSGQVVTLQTTNNKLAAVSNAKTVNGYSADGGTEITRTGGSPRIEAKPAVNINETASATGLFSPDKYLSGGDDPFYNPYADADAKGSYEGKASTLSQDISSAPNGSGITVHGPATGELKFVDGSSGFSYDSERRSWTVGKNGSGSASIGGLNVSLSGGVMTFTAPSAGTYGDNYYVSDGYTININEPAVPAQPAVPPTITTTTYTAILPMDTSGIVNLQTGTDGTYATFDLDLSQYADSTSQTDLENLFKELYGTAVSHSGVGYEFIDSAILGLGKVPKVGGFPLDLNDVRQSVKNGETIGNALAKLFTDHISDSVISRNANNNADTVTLRAFSAGADGNSETIYARKGTIRSYDVDYGTWFANNPQAVIPDDLYGKGFRAYCATCDEQWFNFIFTPDMTDWEERPESGTDTEDIKSILIDVSKVTDAGSLVKAIYEQAMPVLTGEEKQFMDSKVTYDHFMRLAADTEKGILTLYDNRRHPVNNTTYYPEYQEKGAKIADGIFDNVIPDERDLACKELIIQDTDHDSMNIRLMIPRTTLDHIFSFNPDNYSIDEYDVLTKNHRDKLLGTDKKRGILDRGITYLLDAATLVGAQTQRLENSNKNIVTNKENTQASESVIRDADMAKEMMGYVKYNILTQSSQAMLAQANQNGSQVLSLLQ
ncbi:MAG: hypothetical protein E7201_03930 [Selenomonas ruminantium]|uniref:Flagellin n=1 Tax=Selenomonas ruminantium TaxID=971 RepID=A0A927WRW7_SELRU|nr:hypothetical protein [Selenomonas ruminantium]